MTYTTEQLEAMLAAATTGPWIDDNNEGYGANRVWAKCAPSGNGTPGPCVASVIGDSAEAEANAALIAHAPTVTAELIAARKRIASLEDALVGIKRAGRARMLSYGDEHSYYYHTAHAALEADQ